MKKIYVITHIKLRNIVSFVQITKKKIISLTAEKKFAVALLL